MPVLEFVMLLQFWAWWGAPVAEFDHNVSVDEMAAVTENCQLIRGRSPVRSAVRCRPTNIVCTCLLILWVSVITVQVLEPSTASYFAWVAIVLWSVETFPQLYTNIASPASATSGQSAVSILITCIGKTTDGLSAYLLAMPTQIRVLAYFSGTAAWLNALYVLVLFLRPVAVENSRQANNSPTADASDTHSSGGCVVSLASRAELSIHRTLVSSTWVRIALATTLVVLMLAVVVAIVLTVWQWWVIALPVASALIVGSFHCITLVTSKRNMVK